MMSHTDLTPAEGERGTSLVILRENPDRHVSRRSLSAVELGQRCLRRLREP